MTILLVDDEATLLKMGRLILERQGFRVVTASDGEEGLILAKVEQPAAIFLDLMMPKLSGHQVLRRLKADPDTQHIPVIMLTAGGDDRDVDTSYQLGAVFHVQKPFNTKALLENLRAALVQSGRRLPPSSPRS